MWWQASDTARERWKWWHETETVGVECSVAYAPLGVMKYKSSHTSTGNYPLFC